MAKRWAVANGNWNTAATWNDPGGGATVPSPGDTCHANGYTVTREQHLQPHYVKTLDTWAQNLQDKKDEAIAITSEEIYERFYKYLAGCADLFRDGYTDVVQFTLRKPG